LLIGQQSKLQDVDGKIYDAALSASLFCLIKFFLSFLFLIFSFHFCAFKIIGRAFAKIIQFGF